MLVTQKKQYALRAVFELAKREGRGPIKSADIADAQAIPLRFLEVILSRLKRSGLVVSKRGMHGGYTLSDTPGNITVGSVFRLLDDDEFLSDCVACAHKKTCPFLGDCVFMGMWDSAHQAMYDVYDRTSIQNLIDSEKASLLELA